MEEPEVKTSADLRRDLRRKKILDSAKNRLEKLNGKASERENLDTAETLQYSDPEVEPNIPNIGSTYLQSDTLNGFLDGTSDAAANSPGDAGPQNIFIRSRSHIFVASCVAFLLALYTKNCAFLPIAILMLELIFFKAQRRGSPFANTIMPILLLFISTGLSNKIKQISSLLSIMQSILADLAINIFVLCVGCYLLQNFSNSYTIEIK